MAQWVKNPPAMQQTQETWVRSLGQEDPLEKEMSTHSSILAWKIPRTEEPGGLQSMGSQRAGHDWVINNNNAYIQNLGKWYWWAYLQGRDGDTDIEKGLVDTLGEGKGGMNWESSNDIYTLSKVQSLSRVWLFMTPWFTALQASLSITNFQVHSDSYPSS